VKWATESSEKETMHESPGGAVVAVGIVSSRCLELGLEGHFSPSLIGEEVCGIHDSAAQFLVDYDGAIRKSPYSNVGLSSGATCSPALVSA